MMNQEVFKQYIPRAMDNQSGVLMNIVNNARFYPTAGLCSTILSTAKIIG
jgi:hypothetical protein